MANQRNPLQNGFQRFWKPMQIDKMWVWTSADMKLERLDDPADHEQACGATPINGLLLAVRQHQLQPHLLGLKHADDSASVGQRVPGHTAPSRSPNGLVPDTMATEQRRTSPHRSNSVEPLRTQDPMNPPRGPACSPQTINPPTQKDTHVQQPR